MRSTTRARLAQCRAVAGWEASRLVRAWSAWCASRSFLVTSPRRG